MSPLPPHYPVPPSAGGEVTEPNENEEPMSYTPEQVAQVVHEANRALQVVNGEPGVSHHWAEAEDWQRKASVESVEAALEGQTPEQQHETWAAAKRADDWVYGPAKDAVAKTHPCLVAYADLPEEQQAKDALLVAVVGALAG